MRGAFIVFEGIDGSGKTTICERLRGELEKRGRKVILTQEPTHDEIGTFIRNGSVRGISQKAEALLFVADRAIHTDRIRELVDDGYVVICDRYFASTVAYQSSPLNGECLDREWLIEMNRPIIMKPDKTFLLDIDVDLSMERVNVRGERSKFEDAEFQRSVRRSYLGLAKQFDFAIIDASRTQEEILGDVMGRIREII